MRPMWAELFHADGVTKDGHDEANNGFRNFVNATKNENVCEEDVKTVTVVVWNKCRET